MRCTAGRVAEGESETMEEESIGMSPLQVEVSISWMTFVRSCPSRQRIYVAIRVKEYLVANMIDRMILRGIPLEIWPHLVITVNMETHISRIRTLRKRMV